MVEFPKSLYEPVRHDEASSEAVLLEPWDAPNLPSGFDPGEFEPGEITADGEIAAGERLRKVSYIECFFVPEAEKVVIQENGCVVYRVLYDCFDCVDTYWVRRWHEPMKVLSDRAWRSQSYRYVVVCPDGTHKVLPQEQPIFPPPSAPAPPGPSSPPGGPFLPPAELIVESKQGASEHGPDGAYLVQRQLVSRWRPPAKQSGCYVTATYQDMWKVTRRKIPDGVETVSYEALSPPVPTQQRTFRIPGCGESAANPFRDAFKVQGEDHGEARFSWEPIAEISMLGEHLRMTIHVGPAARAKASSHDALHALLEKHLGYLLKTALPDVVEALVGDAEGTSDAHGGCGPVKERA